MYYNLKLCILYVLDNYTEAPLKIAMIYSIADFEFIVMTEL